MTAIQLARNGGFATGCNAGWRAGIGAVRALPEPGRADRRASLARSPAVLERGAARSEPSRRASSTTTARSTSRCGGFRACARRTRRRSSSTVSFRARRWTDELVRDERGVRATRDAGVGLGRVHPRPPRGARSARRPRRGLLHVLRGHRPLPAAAVRGLRARVRARARSSCTSAARRPLAPACCRCSRRAESGTRGSIAAGSSRCSSASASRSGRRRTSLVGRGGRAARAGTRGRSLAVAKPAQLADPARAEPPALVDRAIVAARGRRLAWDEPCAESAESFSWAASRGRSSSPDVLDRMTDAMTHRGPNDRGTYLADGIALGVRRLSIVDVAAATSRSRTRTGTSGRSRTASSTTTTTSAPRLERSGTVREPLRHRDPAAPLRGARHRASQSTCAASSASPSGTGANGAP